MKVIQSPIFKRTVKKFDKKLKRILDDEIRKIVKNPELGNEKKGDLVGVRVHKFKVKNQQYLLSYRGSENLLELITIGSHENYYRDLKRCI